MSTNENLCLWISIGTYSQGQAGNQYWDHKLTTPHWNTHHRGKKSAQIIEAAKSNKCSPSWIWGREHSGDSTSNSCSLQAHRQEHGEWGISLQKGDFPAALVGTHKSLGSQAASEVTGGTHFGHLRCCFQVASAAPECGGHREHIQLVRVLNETSWENAKCLIPSKPHRQTFCCNLVRLPYDGKLSNDKKGK